MSILNFFGRFKKGGEASKTPEGQEINRFIEEQKIELRGIENFFQILSPYQNQKTLSMTLEEFKKYLEEQAETIRENIRIETNPSKINDLNNELTNIDSIRAFIDRYISYSESKRYDLPEITEKTGLYNFIHYLNERVAKIEEILRCQK
jgi:hypothetical protein